jgi:hypothetical protein
MCPHCGTLHDAATGNSTEVSPGAVLICLECGALGVMDASAFGSWRSMTPEEERRALADEDVRLLIAVARAVRKQVRP